MKDDFLQLTYSSKVVSIINAFRDKTKNWHCVHFGINFEHYIKLRMRDNA